MSQEIDTLLLKKQDDLLYMIGQELFENEKSNRRAFPPNRAEIIERASRYFNSKYSEIKSVLCTPESRDKIANSKNETTVVAAISDLIASIVIGVSPITVAVLVILYGVDKICDTEGV